MAADDEPFDPLAARREFLKLMGGVAAGAAIPPITLGSTSLSAHPALPTQPKLPAPQFLTAVELNFLDAALARLIPQDELGPGAREAGVASFIDRQLASPWGTGARRYRQGPWGEGTPQQGYQLPLTPQEVYRRAIAETDQYCATKYGRRFEELDDREREETLHALESDAVPLESMPSTVFFQLLWSNTVEGFFGDPLYGGNRAKVGWELIGFPGVAAAYIGYIEKHNQPYKVVPVSIADVQQGIVATDQHGHPKHVSVLRKKTGQT